MSGVRLGKAIAATRLCSRREADRLIEAGKVAVNGKVVPPQGVLVSDSDKIVVNGKALSRKVATDLRNDVFLCYKMRRELVTYSDPEGRATVFDRLRSMGVPDNLVPVGRLDMNSEGLLLLTTDGEYARELELPENGYVRRYRARISRGVFSEKAARRLGQGIKVKKSRQAYRPIEVRLAFEQRKSMRGLRMAKQRRGKHVDASWLDVAVTEGKNREVRRALEAVGLTVDRLIRVQYGPYKLDGVPKGSVVRVKRKQQKVVRREKEPKLPEPPAEKPEEEIAPLD